MKLSRNRRNKRIIRNITDTISSKTFIKITTVLIGIIAVCIGIILCKNYQDKLEFAKQKEKLNKQIEAIFTETSKNIENVNSNKKDVILSFSTVGDILCGDEMLEDAYDKENNTYSFDPMFENIKDIFKKSDINIGTMETNYTSDKYSGYGKRNSPKEFAQAVKNSGINLVSICTNHSLDYGIEGLKSTKNYLQDLGFTTVGDSTENNRVTITTIKNIKIAFLSYTYGLEEQQNKSKEELKNINIYNEKIAKEDLKYAKENAEFTFVIMHWGEDFQTKKSKEQEKIADFLVKNGANIIIGNHPAVPQPIEIRKNKDGENVLIAYSLGNYISSIVNEKSKVELFLNIKLRKRAEDGKVVLNNVDYIPVYVLDNGKKAKNRYELINLRETAKKYANGEETKINKKTYKKLIQGLEFLENEILPKTK